MLAKSESQLALKHYSIAQDQSIQFIYGDLHACYGRNSKDYFGQHRQLPIKGNGRRQ